MTAPAALICCAALLAGACQATPPGDDPPGEVPARLVNPTEATREELQRVVSDMLFGAKITLADAALTHSSVLVVERSRTGSIQNPPLSGRDLGRPERFQLVRTGGRCVLIHGDDQARYELTEAECVAEE